MRERILAVCCFLLASIGCGGRSSSYSIAADEAHRAYLFPPAHPHQPEEQLHEVATIDGDHAAAVAPAAQCGPTPAYARCGDHRCTSYPPQTRAGATPVDAFSAPSLSHLGGSQSRRGAPFCVPGTGNSMVAVSVDGNRRLHGSVYHLYGFCYPDPATVTTALETIQADWKRAGGQCMTTTERDHLDRAMRQMLPVAVSASLASAFGLDSDQHYVDLQEGMRIVVEYVAHPQSQDAPGGQGIIGMGRADYQVDAVGGVLTVDPFLPALKPEVDVSNQPKPGNVRAVAGEVDLYADTFRPTRARLFLKKIVRASSNGTGAPSLEPAENALLVRTADDAAMAKVTAAINSDVPPAEIKKVCGLDESKIQCVEFRQGGVPIPQILVSVNGTDRWVTLGSTVRNVVAPSVDLRHDASVSAWPAVFVMRAFGGGWYPIDGTPDQLLELPLVKGDRVRW